MLILIVLTYMAGILTILSPCILPVLPFIFSRSEQSFLKSGLPLLGGMSVTFTLFSILAVVGGEWIAHANEVGRWIAMILLSIFGASLIFPHLSEKLLSPITRLGSQLGNQTGGTTIRGSFLIGIGTGLLWAPCAGPILGVVLTGAASQGNIGASVALLLSYSLGAATSLAVALLAGNQVFNLMKKFLGWDQIIKKTLGVLVLLGVAAIAFHLDRTVLLNVSKIETASLENKLLNTFKPESIGGIQASSNQTVPSETESTLPELNGGTAWLNSQPLTRDQLRGKVVLVDFWTYSCINCLRTLPYVKSWAQRYQKDGLIVIGVHTPEFAFEKNVSNIQNSLKELGVTYPVLVDNNYQIWNAFQNHYWPAHYFIDRKGLIRHHHFGEGMYEESETIIRTLLTESGETLQAEENQPILAHGVQAKVTLGDVRSPETYLGYARAEHFISSTPVQKNQQASYSFKGKLELNQWTLLGDWLISAESATLKSADGKIRYQFHARDLHLVLGAEKKTSFRVRLDGKPPKENHGVDTNENGEGFVNSERLYQLIRQKSDTPITPHLFEIEFLDAPVSAYAFTFG